MNKIILGFVALAMAGFFMILVNADTANQTASNLSMNATVLQVPSNTSINDTPNTVVTANAVNATVNTNVTNNVVPTVPSIPLATTLSIAAQGVSQGQNDQVTASASGGIGPYTYAWFETVPNTGQIIQIQGCNSNVCGFNAGSSTGMYSVYVIATDSQGETVGSQMLNIFVYPSLAGVGQ